MLRRRFLVPFAALLAMAAAAPVFFGGGSQAQEADVVAIANPAPSASAELRVWQSVRSPLRLWVSARPDADASWSTSELNLAMIEGGGWRIASRTVDALDGEIELRVWQHPNSLSRVYLSARPGAGGSWDEHGTQRLRLDETSRSGRYRYGDASVALEWPDADAPEPGSDAVTLCPPEGLDTETLSARVWRSVATPRRYYISSRPDTDARWTLQRLTLAETGEDGWSAASLTVDAGEADFELQLWARGNAVALSARVAGTPWDEYGTKSVTLNRTSRSGNYTYANRTVRLTLPEAEPPRPGASARTWDCPETTPDTGTGEPEATPTPTPDPDNKPPYADAGDKQIVKVGDTVTLDGTGSADPDGDDITYAWTQTGGSYTGTVTLSDATAEQPTFTVEDTLSGETVVFTLTVTDEGGLTKTDTVEIEVLVQQQQGGGAPPGGGGPPPTSPGTQGPTLNVSAIAITTATLTITNHTAQWWYKADTGPHTMCQGPIAADTDTADLTGLTASTSYIYKAYSATGCADTNLLATAGAFTTDDPSLSVSNVTATTATLTIAGHSGQWWYTVGTQIACSDAGSSATKDVTGLSPSTNYTASAYSDSSCANLLATKQFSTLDTGIAASNITATTATLTMDGNHSGQWWYKADTGPDATCQGPVTAGDTTENLDDLSPGTTYTYSAYSATGCASANLLATAAAFTTSASLSAGTPTATTATLTIAGHTAQWWYKATTGPHTTCQGPVAANTAAKTVTGLSVGTSYTYSAYGDSSCANLLATAAAVTTETPALAASNETATGATLTLTNWTIAKDGSWYYKYTSPNGGTCSTAQSALTATVGSLSPGTMYTFKVYSDNGCSTVIATASPFTTKPQLTATGVTATGATLNLYGHTANTQWWYKSTTTGKTTCTSAGTGTSVTLSGLDEGTSYTFTAYSNDTCTTVIAAANMFTTDISLTASDVTATTATLTIAGHTENWYYKHTNTGATCDGPVSGTTKDLTGLTPGTSYTYSAYSDSECRTSVATASSFTTPAQLTTSNLTARGVTLNLDGHTGDWYYEANKTPHNTCSSVVSSGTYTKAITGLAPGTTYVYGAYSDSTCTTILDGAQFTTPVELTAGSTQTATTATLTIAGHTAQWWYKANTGPSNTCRGPVAAGTNSTYQIGLTPGVSYTYWAYSATGCDDDDLLATATFTTKSPVLTSSNVTKNSATLSLGNWDGNKDPTWTYKSATAGKTTCTTAPTLATQATVTGLTAGTAYVFTAYSNSGCTTVLDAAPSFTTTANVAPTISVPASANVTASNPYSPSATANDSDDDNDDLTWAWSWTGPSILIKGAATATPTFSIPNGYVGMKYTVSVTITDEDGATASGSIALTIHNRAPNAVASGTSAGLGGDTIYLHGFNSTDPDSGQTLTCSFAQTGGTYTGTVTITSPNACTGARFVMPSDATNGQTIIVTLTVTDSKGGTDTDDWTVTASTPNQAPSANAGPDQTVIAGATVNLDGSGSSDPNDSDTLTYSWSKDDSNSTYTGASR